MKYVKVSNKLRRALLNAVSEATMSMMDEYAPRHLEGPPEIWDEDTKRIFDLLGEFESRATRLVEATLVK